MVSLIQDLVFAAASLTNFTNARLNAGNFRSGAGANAQTADQHILFDTSTGNLYYDAHGNGGQRWCNSCTWTCSA